MFYRFSHWASRHRILPRLIYGLARFLFPLVRMFSGVELQPRTVIGPGLCIFHFGPTVIHPDTIAGENLTILPGVTIGEARTGTPVLGNDVSIGTGATVIGAIHVGNRVRIGAGAVVTHDLPDDCSAVGVPAKPLQKRAD